MVTVDILLLRSYRRKMQVLLVQRGEGPYTGQWALPGGFVDKNESLTSAAYRELQEETNIHNVPLLQLGAFGDPGRDPRGHTVTVVYGGVLPKRFRGNIVAGDDAAHLNWHKVEKLPKLAFDHETIISQCLRRFQELGILDKL